MLGLLLFVVYPYYFNYFDLNGLFVLFANILKLTILRAGNVNVNRNNRKESAQYFRYYLCNDAHASLSNDYDATKLRLWRTEKFYTGEEKMTGIQ